MTTSNVDTARARRWAEPDEDGEDTMLDLERMKIMHALADEVDRLRAERALLVALETKLRAWYADADNGPAEVFDELLALDAHREAHRE